MSDTWKPPKLPFTPDPDRLKGHLRTVKAALAATFTKKRLLIMGGILGAFLVITPFATYAYYARDIGDQERLMNRKDTGIILKDRNGEVIYKQGNITGDKDVTLPQISDDLEKALIASEDKDFYTHDGFSLHGIARSLYANVASKDATHSGGSTITQQLVKNNLLSTRKSYLRKYQEVSMAIAVERKYTKQQILEMYLNSVYFGEGAFGINDAARTYFGKSPAQLNTAESAMLVGILPAPSTYSPISGDQAAAKQQQARVLGLMVKNGDITKAQEAAAEQQPIAYATESPQSFDHAQHFALMVLDELKHKYGEERMSRSGFVVNTTLDLGAQKQAEEIVRRQITERFAAGGGRNAGLVAIDPKTGQVKALVGSVDWNNDQFGKVNMAVSPRQPGSSFKPIFYGEAIDKKLITAATVLHDKPTDFGGWKPENFDFKFKGDMPARNALAESRNLPAAEVMQKLGPAQASLAAQRMGISTVNEPDKYGLTLAVGTAEVKLEDMVNAYAAFANQGLQYTPITYTEVRDKYGQLIYQRPAEQPHRVQSEQASFIISSILSDEQARAPTYGSSLNIAGRQVALKTGTTDESKDAWTIGYTPSLALGIWVGNNEHEPMHGLAGGSSAGLIWREAMTDLLEGTPVEHFTPPAGVRQVAVCSAGKTYSEYFIDGSDTSGNCNNRNIAGDPDISEKTRREAAKQAEKAMKEAQRQLEEQAQRIQDQIDEQRAAAEEQLQDGGRGAGDPGPTDTGGDQQAPPDPGSTDPPPRGNGNGNGNGNGGG
jgi:1A family penicillin-binding protein